MNYSIEVYVADNGRCPYEDWFASLDPKTQARVESRVARLRSGNFGDWKPVGDGVCELRLQFGAGYRVYYGRIDNRIVLLITGGSKRTQKRDIQTVKAIWKTYQK